MLIELTSEVNPAQLDEELRAALGRNERPGVSVRQPQGGEKGVLRVSDDLDEKKVKAVIAAHKPDPDFGLTEEQHAERRTNDMLAPLVEKAARVRSGVATFTPEEMQTILAAVVLRPRPGGGNAPTPPRPAR